MYGTGTVSLQSDGIHLKRGNTDTDGYILIGQFLEPEMIQDGSKVTLSALTADNRFITGSGTAGHGLTINGLTSELNDRIDLINIEGKYMVRIVMVSQTENKIKAIKLEFGSRQTLAHKEGDTWVLNDPPPNKVLELLKCQRYFLRLPGEWSSYTLIGHGKATSNSQLDLQLPIPTAMLVRPSVRMTGEWVAVGAGMYEAFTAENMTVALSSIWTAEACIIISGFTSLIPNHVYTIQRNNDGTGNIDLSSEI